MFYDGGIESSRRSEDLFPDSVEHLREYFWNFGKRQDTIPSRIPRFVVDFGSSEELYFESFWNERHHNWVMARVIELLHDPKFVKVDGSQPGTILIISPY